MRRPQSSPPELQSLSKTSKSKISQRLSVHYRLIIAKILQSQLEIAFKIVAAGLRAQNIGWVGPSWDFLIFPCEKF
jgi:hypothetical protein